MRTAIVAAIVGILCFGGGYLLGDNHAHHAMTELMRTQTAVELEQRVVWAAELRADDAEGVLNSLEKSMDLIAVAIAGKEPMDHTVTRTALLYAKTYRVQYPAPENAALAAVFSGLPRPQLKLCPKASGAMRELIARVDASQ